MTSSRATREHLVLRLDAPMMSFGKSRVDELNETARFPYRSLLAGLIGNALGYEHADAERLERLQSRLLFAARADAPGERLVDYHTVDLGQPHLAKPGWTTRGHTISRGKGAANMGTHIRHRHYLVGAVYTLAVALEPADESPTIGEVESALRRPARPLFLGRKCCLPALPLVLSTVVATSPFDALRHVPPASRASTEDEVAVWWTETAAAGEPKHGVERLAVFQDRDWANQVHTGRSFVRHSTMRPASAEEVQS